MRALTKITIVAKVVAWLAGRVLSRPSHVDENEPSMSPSTRHGSRRASSEPAARLRCLFVPVPSSKPSSKPSSCATGPAPETPRKHALLAPAACLTTLPPRCCVMVVKQSSGAGQQQRGKPGARTGAMQDLGSGGEQQQKQQQPSRKPITGASGLESAPGGAGDRFAIEARCACSRRANARGGDGGRRR
jgi:hypothetical protein